MAGDSKHDVEKTKPELEGARRQARQPTKHDARPDSGTVQPRAYPDIVDDTLDDSFPASDPPFWAGH